MTALVALLFVAPPVSEYSEAWDKAEGMIRRLFYARESRKAEMEKLFALYGPKAKAATSKREFSDAVNRMIDDFKDSHFALLDDESQGFYNFDSLASRTPAKMPHVGAWFKRTTDGYTVQMVLEGGPAEQAGLRKGDLITMVDGQPFSPILSLRAKAGSTVTAQVKRQTEVFTKALHVKEETAKEMFLSGTKNSARVIEQGPKKIGYVHLWTMADEDQKSTLSNLVYGRFKDTDAIILDLRDGFGGRPEGFGDPFFRPEASLEWKFGENAGMKQIFGYGRPLVIITNEGSRSAKEVFSYIMKKSKRATLVGSTTAGHVLGTSPLRLNEWSYLEIPAVDVVTDGIRIEGKGVSPDIAIKTEYDPQGKDKFLEKALEVAVKAKAK